MIHLFNGTLQSGDNRSIGRGGTRRLNVLFVSYLNLYGKSFFHFFRDLTDFLQDIFKVVLREHAAIHVKDVFTGNGVDVAHVGLFFRWFKRADGRIKKRVHCIKFFAKLCQFCHQVRCCRERVVAQLRFAAMTLFPRCFKAQPENAFFRDFNEGPFRIPGVRNHNEITLVKNLFRQIQDIIKPFAT